MVHSSFLSAEIYDLVYPTKEIQSRRTFTWLQEELLSVTVTVRKVTGGLEGTKRLGARGGKIGGAVGFEVTQVKPRVGILIQTSCQFGARMRGVLGHGGVSWDNLQNTQRPK